jgi:hypothetical protein
MTGTRLGACVRHHFPLQVSYQAGACGHTENKRPSIGRAYQFCFKVRNGLRLKQTSLQPLTIRVCHETESLRSL